LSTAPAAAVIRIVRPMGGESSDVVIRDMAIVAIRPDAGADIFGADAIDGEDRFWS